MFNIRVNDTTLDGKNSTLGLIHYILEHGAPVASRLGPSWEILGAKIRVPSSMTPYRPGMIRRLGMVELLQVLSGYFDERHLKKAAPGLKYPYGHVHAYGTKIYQQLPNVIDQLTVDPETRRAMVHIGKPEDGYEVEKPCMQSYQFMVRNGRLYSFLYARSWDVVSGLPYDIMTLNGVAQVIAQLIGASLSTTTCFAASAHVYQNSWDDVLTRYRHRLHADPPYRWFVISKEFESLDEVRTWAIDELNDMDNWVSGMPKGVTRG